MSTTGNADLAVSDSELRAIGDAAAELARVAGTSNAPFEESGAALAALDAAGLAAGGALYWAAHRFSIQGANLSRDCTAIANALGSTVSTLAAVTEQIETSVQGLTTRVGLYAPPEAQD